MNNYICKQITEKSPHYNQVILSVADIRKLANYQKKRSLYMNPAKQGSYRHALFELYFKVAKGA